MKGDSGNGGAPQIQDLFVDIGVNSRKAAEKLVRVGDPITLNDQFEILRDDLAIARAFDNRVGTWAVAETAPAQKRQDKAQRRGLRRGQHHGGSRPVWS